MALFLSDFEKKIDKKGRVSVPSSFRAVLASESFNGVVLYHSFINNCIEACSMSKMERMAENIDNLDPFSEEYDAFTATIMGGSTPLSFDGEGRIIIPLPLLEGAEIDDKAVFFGKGKTFEIWQPEAFAEYVAESRNIALKNRGKLRSTAFLAENGGRK